MPTLSPKTTPYYGGGQVVNPANVIKTSGAPSAKILGQGLGTLAVDNATGAVYCLASKSGSTSTWGVIRGGTGTSGQTAAMTAGTITVTTSKVAANSVILLTNALVGGTVGTLSVGTIVAGTSFVINSSSNIDTSKVNWLIVN